MNTFFQHVWTLLIDYWPSLLLGVRTTLTVSLIGTAAGFAIGLLIGGIKAVKLDFTSSKSSRILKKIYNFLASAYIEIFRGTPMMVQAIFIYYALLNVLHWDNLTAAIFVISINTGAYMSEIVRGGIFAVDRGQFEAAQAIGMTHSQTMNKIVLPQVIRNILPAIGNEAVINIKDTAVLSVISVGDLFFQGTAAAGTNYEFFQTFLIVGVIYLVMTLSATRLLRLMEKKMDGPSSYVKVEDLPQGNE